MISSVIGTKTSPLVHAEWPRRSWRTRVSTKIAPYEEKFTANPGREQHGEGARELGAFLRERRNRLTPAVAGLPAGGSRRTPGLRREEVAELAGLSVGYYTRLEQGHAAHPSGSVLSALARTFHLSEDEERHSERSPAKPSAAPPELLRRSDHHPLGYA